MRGLDKNPFGYTFKTASSSSSFFFGIYSGMFIILLIELFLWFLKTFDIYRKISFNN